MHKCVQDHSFSSEEKRAVSKRFIGKCVGHATSAFLLIKGGRSQASGSAADDDVERHKQITFIIEMIDILTVFLSRIENGDIIGPPLFQNNEVSRRVCIVGGYVCAVCVCKNVSSMCEIVCLTTKSFA